MTRKTTYGETQLHHSHTSTICTIVRLKTQTQPRINSGNGACVCFPPLHACNRTISCAIQMDSADNGEFPFHSICNQIEYGWNIQCNTGTSIVTSIHYISCVLCSIEIPENRILTRKYLVVPKLLILFDITVNR